jgi:quercetin dioxygenase-like cupin family protein
MTMSTRKAKLMLAGVLVACAFGGIALQLAWASSSSGVTTTIYSGPVVLGDSHEKSESEINEVEIETKGLSDVYVVYNKIAPGGYTGWHSHPGISIISVKSGTVSEYHPDDLDTPHVHVAGTSFVEPADTVHNMVNEGDSDVELVAVQILPLGAKRRIEAPAP